LGSMRDIMKMIPGMGSVADQMGDANPEGEMSRIEGIIDSMTLAERQNPDLIDRSRRSRIAKGCGLDPSEVSKLLKEFAGMAKMMQGMSSMGLKDRLKTMRGMADSGMLNPGAELVDKKLRSQRGPRDSTVAREKKKKQRKQAQKARKRNRKR